MDQRKAEGALKEIFSKYGFGVMCDVNKFRSAIYDLLDPWNDKEERHVFRNAIESDALRLLAGTAPVTKETAAQVVGQLKKSHMTEEDARFVVWCILAARGDGTATSMGKRQEENSCRETRNCQDAQSRTVGSGDAQAQNQAWQDTGSQSTMQQGTSQKSNDGCIAEAECKMTRAPSSVFPLGKLRLYQDRLLFVPYLNREDKKIEIYYQNISRVENLENNTKAARRMIDKALLIGTFIYGVLLLMIAGVYGLASTILFAAFLLLVRLLIAAWFRYFCRHRINIFSSGASHIIHLDKPSDKQRIEQVIRNMAAKP